MVNDRDHGLPGWGAGVVPDGVVNAGILEKLTCVARSQPRVDLGEEHPGTARASSKSPSQEGAGSP